MGIGYCVACEGGFFVVRVLGIGGGSIDFETAVDGVADFGAELLVSEVCSSRSTAADETGDEDDEQGDDENGDDGGEQDNRG